MSVDDAVRPLPGTDVEPLLATDHRVPDLPDTGRLPGLRTGLVARAQAPSLWLLRRAWRVHVHGVEHVPTTGPVILAGNHIAVLDGPLIVAASPRPTFALAKCELFVGALGSFLHQCGQIPLDRQRVDPAAIRRSVQVLDAGHALAVFPEGIRGAGEVEHAHGGTAYLALLTGAPVVPVALLGTREPGSSTRSLPRVGRDLHVVFGAPIPVTRRPWPRTPDTVAVHTEELRGRLAAHVLEAQQRTGVELPGPAPLVVPGARRRR